MLFINQCVHVKENSLCQDNDNSASYPILDKKDFELLDFSIRIKCYTKMRHEVPLILESCDDVKILNSTAFDFIVKSH